MSTKPVYEKLRMVEGISVLVLNSPGDYEEIIGALPEYIEFRTSPTEEVDFVHLFAMNRAELDKYIAVAIESIKYDGLLWVSYPKGSSGVETDINRDRIWEHLKQKDIRPVTQISINETWSALRFRPKDAVGK
jgi:hypothetical protein